MSVRSTIINLELSVRLVRGRRESLVCLSKVVKYRKLTEGTSNSTLHAGNSNFRSGTMIVSKVKVICQ